MAQDSQTEIKADLQRENPQSAGGTGTGHNDGLRGQGAAESVPGPHELWTQAKGDGQEYRRLMILHGHLRPVTLENRPSDHVFEGRTPSCACTKCGGAFGASWHVQMVSGGAAGGGKTEKQRMDDRYRADRYYDKEVLLDPGEPA